MPPRDIDMDPGGVATTGNWMSSVGDDARGRTGKLLDSSETAAKDNAGWTSAKALTDCQSSWELYMNHLVFQTEAVGNQLTNAAKTQQNVEQTAVDRLSHVMHDFADG